MKRHLIAILALGLSFAASARAHFVWLERDAATGSTAAYFGEWAAGLRETRDGYLKLIAAPRAFAADGSELPVKIEHDHIAIAAPATPIPGDLRLENLYRPEKGDNLVHYQAKLGRADTAARFALELVPVAADSNTFTLLLRGEPLAETDVTLFTSSGWNRTFKTDAPGRVTLETPWPGQCVVEAGHVENRAGEHEGRAHQGVRHVATVTFVAKP